LDTERRSNMTKPRGWASRASERLPLPIDCSKNELRNLMTEQCRIRGGFATYYAGSREDFIAAGLPERSLPAPKSRRTKLRIALGWHCCQAEADAWLTPNGATLELEIHWDPSGPGGCGHPALVEMARMMIIDLAYWTGPQYPSLEVPVDRLLNSKGEVDYTMPAHKRLQYTAAFRDRLRQLHDTLFHTIRWRGGCVG
jgi:hypothetical protein